MWSPNATCRIFSDLTFPPKASSPRLVFEQPRTDKTTLNIMPGTSTVTPVSSQRRCTAATQLLGGLSCLICGKMLAALPKNLQKLGREKILDEKAAGAVCSPTWCTRFSAKCGHPLFTVISAACIVERPLFCRAMFVQPTSSRAWSGHPEMYFSKLRKIHILQAGQICILHHLHAYVAICKFFFGCKDRFVF